MIEKINEAKDFISTFTNNKNIDTMIILGSGMGGFEDNYEPLSQVDYSDIPNFLTPSIEGHAGKLSLVSINNKLTAILSGRAHYYEGYPIQDLVIPIRAFSLLGVKNLVLTNAAGGISENHFQFKTGIYAWFTGPSYETPAEVQYAKNIGADLVGMSTVPEAIVAKHAGMEISAFSLVTNLAAGISKDPLNHEEVVEIADKSKQKLQGFMKEFLSELNSDN